MSLITITKGPGKFSRQKTEEDGTRLKEIEDISYNEETFHVSYKKSTWLIDEELFSIVENEDNTISIFQGNSEICKGSDVIKTNF